MRNLGRCFFVAGCVAALSAGLCAAGEAASVRPDRFSPPNWPEEMVYWPDCSTELGDDKPFGCDQLAHHRP
jgi:hypothetical protein